MKQTLFMLGLMVVAVPGALINPFIGLTIYYGFAVLYPQSLWYQSIPRFRWSWWLGLATVLSLILHGFARSGAGMRWSIEKKLVLGLAVMTGLSMIDAVDPQLASRQFDDYAKIFIMFFVACALLDSRYRLRTLVIVLVVGLGWLAFDFNQRYVLMGQKHVIRDGFAALDNNGVAALMVMGMPLCMFLFAQEKKWYLRLPPLAAMVMMLHVVMFSMSRGAMLGGLIALPVFMLRLKRRGMAILITAVIVIVGLRMAGPSVRSRFMTITDYGNESSAQSRMMAWRTSLDVIRDYPILGVGPNCFRRVAGDYNYKLKNRTVHNRFLQTTVDMGIPAGLCLVGALVLGLINLQKLRWQHWHDPFVYDLATCLQGCLVSYLAVGMFASIGTIELPYIILAITVGLRNVVAEEQSSLSVAPAPSKRKRRRPILQGVRPATT